MLWNDFSEKPVRSRVSVVAGVPQTGWEAPREFPNLSGAKVLAIDTEAYDPELLDNGAGWARNRSHMVGASIATDDGHSWYFPIRHSVCPEQNMPVEPVIRFLKAVLETPKIAKVGANLLYDVGMLQHEGVHVKGALWDVQYAEALLVEQGRVNLDHLATKYLGKNKETSLLYQWSQQSYGGDINEQRANIHRCPPSLVGKYAEADASLPLEVFPHVWKELHKQGLHHLYRMECELIPLYVAMRYAGVRVDLEAAEILSHDLTKAYNTERFKLYDVAGFEVNVNSGDDLAKLFESQGLHYPITETGKPSFVKDWLNQHEAPVAQQIVEVRKLLKLRDTFVDKIRSANINGKLYPQFHPLRSTGGGTRSGRYSCVTGDTPIHTASGDVLAKDIVIGDKVLSHTGSYRRVQRVWHRGALPTVKLTFTNGKTLHCATSHILITANMSTITAGELHNEHINSLDNKRGEREGSLTAILGWGVTDDAGNSCSDGHYRTQRTSCNKVPTESRGTQTTARYADSLHTVRGQKPYVWKTCGRHDKLEGRVLERDGLQHPVMEWEAGAYAPCCDDGTLRLETLTCEHGCTPHRWEQVEQRTRQPSDDDIYGAQHYTQVTLSHSELAGNVHVYDYTVEVDHTYLACGVFNHNCSGDMNVQQIPSRDSVWSKRIRGLFVPDIGHKYIRKYDYQAIEYRFLAHFAVGAGADELRKAYNDNPHIDYHNIVMDMVAPVAGWDVSTPELKAQRRKPLKTINFGCIAAGQLVLTHLGEVPIEDVKLTHLLWDGEAFVSHDGVVYSGLKEVITYDGITATPDHPVWDEYQGTATQAFATVAATGTRYIKRAFTADAGKPYRYANTAINRLLNKGETTVPQGYSSISTLFRVWPDEDVHLRQPEAWTLLRLSEAYEVPRSSTQAVNKPARPILSNSAAVRTHNARIRPQLQATRNTLSVYISESLHNLGTGNVPERRVHGNGLRQDQQQWGLRAGKPTCSHQISKPVKQKTYDILNVGTNHRFTINGVLVHNCVFGMGEAKLSRSLGLSHADGKDFLKQYHQSLPYAKATMKACGDFAESNGYIDTILGRRSRFEMFEPIDWADQNDKTPLPWRSAIGKYGYGNVRLTGLHKALNRRLQGCKPASARIWTSEGLPTIGDSIGKQLTVWTGFNWAQADVVPKGKWQMAKVWLSTGEVIDCDTRHKFKLDNGDDWCSFDNLKLGDCVALPSLPEVTEWDGVMNQWYILGYWLGDGWQGESNCWDKRRGRYYIRESGRLVAADTKREKLAEMFSYLIAEGVNVHWSEKDRSAENRNQLNWEINWSSSAACDYFRRIGVTSTIALTKRIPTCVWEATKQQQAAFLAGYLHADGSRCAADRGITTIHSPNVDLLREVQQLAHFMGREAVFHKPSKTGSLLTIGAQRRYPYKLIHADYKAREVTGIDYSTYGSCRGIVAKRAVTKCADTWQTNADRVYHEQNFGVKPYRFARVTQIAITSEVDETYTLSVHDDRHQYVADGFITKNSAADLLKKSLHRCWTEGVFDRTGLPRLLVHDEILLSLPDECDTEALNEMQHIFETALPLRVPILFEGEQGTNWGNTKALT